MNRDTSISFQARVQPWMQTCFGPEISADRVERNHRFLEEALELVQSLGCAATEAHQLVDYVYGRPQGDVNQEVGGVMVTLAALCLAAGIDMHASGETELQRIWGKIEQIRAKQAAKPRSSPLPEAAAPTSELRRVHDAYLDNERRRTEAPSRPAVSVEDVAEAIRDVLPPELEWKERGAGKVLVYLDKTALRHVRAVLALLEPQPPLPRRDRKP